MVPLVIEELLKNIMCFLGLSEPSNSVMILYFFSFASLRYGENEKLPEHIKQKLQCLSSILLMFSNPTSNFH